MAAQSARAAKASKELPEAYPGLEPAYLPSEPLFKFKGQDPLLRGDSSTGNIRAGAAAAPEISVYNMGQQEMTFRDTPLNAAMSITPRHRLSRTASSLGPEVSAVVRTRSSLDRRRSSLADPAARSSIERVGSSMAQYDSEVNKSLVCTAMVWTLSQLTQAACIWRRQHCVYIKWWTSSIAELRHCVTLATLVTFL